MVQDDPVSYAVKELIPVEKCFVDVVYRDENMSPT